MPTPYYQDAAVTIYHGDCRELLPDLAAVDLLLTDPPYGINANTDNSRFTRQHHHRHRPGHRNQRGSAAGRPIANDATPFDPRHLLGLGRVQIIWGWHCFPDALPRGSCLIWLKKHDHNFGKFLSDAETAWLSRGHGVYCHRDTTNLSLQKRRTHPTQKPVGLMRWCIEKAGKVRSVLDPYMGSGATLIAAKQMGLTAVGIELEERFCEAAANRLRQDLLFRSA